MARYFFDIAAGGGLQDRREAEHEDHEAARMYAIDLASARLQEQDASGAPLEVHIVIKDETGEILETMHSIAIPG